MPHPTEFSNVTATCLANVYFQGKVVSHSLTFPDGTKKTLGLIYPGNYHFGTGAAENMKITAGSCRVKIDGNDNWTTHPSGDEFNVPANSGFDITVDDGICQYICSFIV
ncbi:MAG: pyrimidine/purine nucleoside phosphorylase [Phycisphaerales bacterium]|nr:pyrimidine/purine nucleoside phosphorylase [Phycisphaerales bacterium]